MPTNSIDVGSDQPNSYWDEQDALFLDGRKGANPSTPNGAYVPTGSGFFTPEKYGAVGYSTVAAAVASGTDNASALNACFTAACAVGGTVLLDSLYYPCSTQPTISGSCSVVGKGCQEVGWDGYGPTVAPFLTGSVILITGAGIHGLTMTGTGPVVNLDDFGVLFAPAIQLSNTGHGFFAQASAAGGGGHQFGLQSSTWSNVKVFGHDGNHYARYVTNGLNNQYSGFRGYGGGGQLWVSDSTVGIFGNSVDVQPYTLTVVAGTAHGIGFTASGSNLNLITFVRPQHNFQSQASNAAMGNPALPLNTQYLWHAMLGAVAPTEVSVVGVDLEADDGVAHSVNWGTVGVNYTVLLGSRQINLGGGTQGAVYGGVRGIDDGVNVSAGSLSLAALTTGSNNAALGVNAGRAITTGGSHTAVGVQALYTMTTGTECTAVGSNALKLATGNYNTAVGGNAGAALTTAAQSVLVGAFAGAGVTTGGSNIHIGYLAGNTGTSGAFATTTAGNQVFIGTTAGQSSATQSNYAIAIGLNAAINGPSAIAIGRGASAGANGAIAIGSDSAGTGATSSTQDLAVIGTALTTLQVQKIRVPGLAAFAAGDKYVVADASGNFHLSALGPAS